MTEQIYYIRVSVEGMSEKEKFLRDFLGDNDIKYEVLVGTIGVDMGKEGGDKTTVKE